MPVQVSVHDAWLKSGFKLDATVGILNNTVNPEPDLQVVFSIIPWILNHTLNNILTIF